MHAYVDVDGEITCKHGDEECIGNKWELCA